MSYSEDNRCSSWQRIVTEDVGVIVDDGSVLYIDVGVIDSGRCSEISVVVILAVAKGMITTVVAVAEQ